MIGRPEKICPPVGERLARPLAHELAGPSAELAVPSGMVTIGPVRRSTVLVWCVGGALVVGLAAGLVRRLAPSDGSPQADAPPLPARTPSATLLAEASPPPSPPPEVGGAPGARAPRGTHALIVGGGPLPEANELSIEEDVLLAQEVLGDGAQVLFAGGALGRSVQVLDPAPRGDPLLAELGELLAPHRGRDASFRAPRTRASGAATRKGLERALGELLSAGPETVTLVLHGHGDRGERPGDGGFALWGRSSLTPGALDALLTGRSAGLRVISSACFSGSFAELLFRDGDESAGAASGLRCGLFAAPWDLESTGCDPDPEATLREGFGVHFWNALRRRAPDGRALRPAEIDFDGDGKVSFLEAHARARIAATSADVPTTTHERWLRFAVSEAEAAGPPPSAPPGRRLLPEDDAVIAALSARLPAGLDTLAAANEALDDAEAAIADAEGDLADARAVTDDAWSELAGGLLARWPTLDDPWHPDHAADLAAARPGLAAWLHDSEPAAAYRSALEAERRLDDFVRGLRAGAAPLERLERALTNRDLAWRLVKRGGPQLDRWREILACERGAPEP